MLNALLLTLALAQVPEGFTLPTGYDAPAADTQPTEEVATSEVADASAAPSGDFPDITTLGATATVRGLVNPGEVGGNVRPVSLGAGLLHWSERGAFTALVHVAPTVAGAGQGAAGALLLQPGGRLGLGLTGRLHRFTDRSSSPLTVGAYAAGGASLDSTAGVSWTAFRGDIGGTLYWWHSHSSRSTAYAALDVGGIIRRRSGNEAGTWLGFSTGLSVTLTRVTAGLVLTHCPAGSRPLPGLTGTQVYGTVSLSADALSL